MSDQENIHSLKQKIKSLNSSFIIQAGHPKALYLKQNQFEKTNEVFPNLFLENEERLIIGWNKIPVLFSYTYGCYRNFENLINWMEALTTMEEGQYEFVLETEDFLSTIKSNWKENILWINSEWLAKKSHSKLAEVLNEKGLIRVNVHTFLKEWKILLLQIKNAFQNAKVVITNTQEKEKFMKIYTLINRIEGQGKLYTR